MFGKDSNIIFRNKAQLVCCWFSVFSIFSFASIGQSELARDTVNRSLHEPINRGGECFFCFLNIIITTGEGLLSHILCMFAALGI